MTEKEKITFNVDKEKNFSKWFTEILGRAEIADLRYNVKGFVVLREWAAIPIKEMYLVYERALEKKGHKRLIFPSVIPEKNFLLEKEHVEGFAPDVFWITEYGKGEKLEEKLALRPTSETAMYRMYSIWIRSYNDLPFKAYQSNQVWRHETKATRPLIRSREFYWIEAHDVFATEEEALQQVEEDMETAKEVLFEKFGIPLIFFKRPQWDKFPGAVDTYAADCLMPDGKIIQQPSTHFLGQNFSKPFNLKFMDRDGKEKYAYITCYGPAISRIYASLIATHGDNKGLVFPFKLAPLQIIIIPIVVKDKEKKIFDKCRELQKKLSKDFRVEIDLSEQSPGDKFYFWEMKGVPIRIEVGQKELKEKSLTVFRRDTNKRIKIKERQLLAFIKKSDKEILKNLKEKSKNKFDKSIVSIDKLTEVKKAVDSGKIVRTKFCSIDKEGESCAEIIEKQINAFVRGTRVDKKEKPAGKCIVCGKKANTVVYIGKTY